MKIVDHLGRVPLFQGVPPAQIDELAMVLTDQTFGRGETIFAEGDEGRGFYILVSGQVKIYKLSLNGQEQILHMFGPGDVFAEVAVFAGNRYPAHAQAVAASRVFFFPRDTFIDLIQRNPALAMSMLATLSLRLKKFTTMIEALSLKEVPGRLATHLLLLRREAGGRDEVRLNMTKAHLASLLGTIPETLSRILKKMQQQGLIATSGRVITILDPDGLDDLAAGETKL